MFEGIGKIGSYVQQKKTEYAANYKIQTGQTADSVLSSSIKRSISSKSKKVSGSDKMRASLIKNKLKQGKKLSGEEMRFLKDKSPELYRKAKKIMDAREELERDLAKAKTKDEARQALMRAQMKVAGEAAQNSGAGGTNLAGMGGAAMSGGESAAAFSSSMSADIGLADGSTESIDLAGVEADGELNAEAQAGATVAGEAIAADNTSVSANEEITAEGQEATRGEGINANDDEDGIKDDIFESVYLLMLRSLQDAWKEFVHSEDYRKMPEDEADKAKGEKKIEGDAAKITETRLLDLVAIYKQEHARDTMKTE